MIARIRTLLARILAHIDERARQAGEFDAYLESQGVNA